MHRNDAHYRGIFMDRSYSYCEELCIFFGTFEVTASCQKTLETIPICLLLSETILCQPDRHFPSMLSQIRSSCRLVIIVLASKGFCYSLGQSTQVSPATCQALITRLQISPTNYRCSLSHPVLAPGTLSFRRSPSTRHYPCWQWVRLHGLNPGVSFSSS